MPGGRNTILASRLAGLGLRGQACLVGAAVGGAALLALSVAFAVSGPRGLAAASLAAGVCLLGALLALATGALFPSPEAVMQRMALSMLARTMIPLLLGVAIHFKSPTMASAGMIYYLLVFYLVSLAVETAILLAQVPPRSPTPKQSH